MGAANYLKLAARPYYRIRQSGRENWNHFTIDAVWITMVLAARIEFGEVSVAVLAGDGTSDEVDVKSIVADTQNRMSLSGLRGVIGIHHFPVDQFTGLRLCAERLCFRYVTAHVRKLARLTPEKRVRGSCVLRNCRARSAGIAARVVRVSACASGIAGPGQPSDALPGADAVRTRVSPARRALRRPRSVPGPRDENPGAAGRAREARRQ